MLYNNEPIRPKNGSTLQVLAICRISSRNKTTNVVLMTKVAH